MRDTFSRRSFLKAGALTAAGLTVAARREKRGWVCFVCQ